MYDMSKSYDELTTQLQKTGAWIDSAQRTLVAEYAPGSSSGAELAKAIDRATRHWENLRRQVRNHPDAPPQG